MFHATIPMLKDESRVGQVRCAEIQMEVAVSTMKSAYDGAFMKPNLDADFKAMYRRIFYMGRREYDEAKAVWEYHK